MTTIPEFRHKPLPDPKTYIRLLKIVSVPTGDDVDPVHCEISAWLFNEAPEYSAVSYTWGPPPNTSTIILNGGRMEVRPNCEYVLTQTGPHVGNGYLWIDAICIDQRDGNDNLEKNAQVAQMGDVYRKAAQVLACVGPHAHDSEFLYRMMKEDEPLFRPWLASACREGTFNNSSVLHLSSLLIWKAKHRKATIVRLRKALASFLKRPYFHRVWIYQELFLGQKIVVLCSHDSVPISWVWMTLQAVTPDDDTATVESRLRAGATTRESRPLMDALAEVEFLDCQDARDRLYGTLSVIKWTGPRSVQADYSKDPFDLAVAALACEIGNQQRGGNTYLRDDFLMARMIAKCLDLLVAPTKRLADAVQSRRALPLDTSATTPSGSCDGRDTMLHYPLVGLRVSWVEGHWAFEPQVEWRNNPPTMSHWQEARVRQRVGESDIMLPADVQSGDWLLVPESCPPDVVFIARDVADEDGRLELVGKALWNMEAWSESEMLEKIQSNYRIQMDAEDLLVLCQSCDWVALTRTWPDPPAEQDLARYFQTRLRREGDDSVVILRGSF